MYLAWWPYAPTSWRRICRNTSNGWKTNCDSRSASANKAMNILTITYFVEVRCGGWPFFIAVFECPLNQRRKSGFQSKNWNGRYFVEGNMMSVAIDIKVFLPIFSTDCHPHGANKNGTQSYPIAYPTRGVHVRGPLPVPLSQPVTTSSSPLAHVILRLLKNLYQSKACFLTYSRTRAVDIRSSHERHRRVERGPQIHEHYF